MNFLFLIIFASALLPRLENNSVMSAGRLVDKKSWQPLFFDDLSNASYPKGVWLLEDAVLTATQDYPIWTTEEYGDFLLELEFKTAKATNSGVIVYCSDTANWIPNSVEIQIADDYSEEWSKAPKTWQCGAVFGHKGPEKFQVVNKPGIWNKYRIECRGKNIAVTLNDVLINKVDLSDWKSATVNPDGSEIPSWLSTPLADLPTKGYIGLQGKHAGASIWFRNIRIKSL